MNCATRLVAFLRTSLPSVVVSNLQIHGQLSVNLATCCRRVGSLACCLVEFFHRINQGCRVEMHCVVAVPFGKAFSVAFATAG